MKVVRLYVVALLAVMASLADGAAPAPPNDTGTPLPNNAHILMLNAAAVSSPKYVWSGGQGLFVCVGTWGGATVTLQNVGPDGVTLVTVGAYTTFTANGEGSFFMYDGALIQATVTGATGPTSLTCKVHALPIYQVGGHV